MAQRKRLGILQTGHRPEELPSHLDYDSMFKRLLGEDAFDYTTWAVVDGEFPDNAQAADAWLITGSRYGAYEEHAWIPPLEKLIREVHAGGNPMVGICFGHQIIAQALGGTVEKFDKGWSIGRVDYELDSQTLGLDSDAIPLMAFHQDQVTTLPPGAENVGSSDFCEHAALLYDNRILTLQPHPEFEGEFVGALLRSRAGLLPTALREEAETTLDQPIANQQIAKTLRRFLDRDTSTS